MVGSIRSESSAVGLDVFKAIIFAPTAALVDFYGTILESIPNLPHVSVLHSRVTQNKRTKVTNEFREAKSGILVATDVVARGMDFPLVTNVFQVSLFFCYLFVFSRGAQSKGDFGEALELLNFGL